MALNYAGIEPTSKVPGSGLAGVMGAQQLFTWDGFIRPAIMAGEVKDPRRSIPLAVTVRLGAAAIVFLGVAAVTLGVLGAGEQASSGELPIVAAASKAIGRWGFWVVRISAWSAALAN